MSLSFFLATIRAEIKSIFEGIPAKLKTAIHIGAVVTDNIKNIVDSPAAGVLTAIIPGYIDDEVKNWLRAKRPAIVTELKLADNCGALTDPSAITVCAVKVLQGPDSDVKNSFLHHRSSLVAQVASDGELSWGDGVYLLEWFYKNESKPAA